VLFYKALLKMGRDVRTNGIIWIIKKLEEIEFRVEENDLP
jgi:hypothetical protein